MAYGLSSDLRRLFLASMRASRKVEDMLANSRVSLLWDNRTGNLADHGEGVLVTAAGRASISAAPLGGEASAALLERNPNLADFMSRDGVVTVEVAVDSYALVVGYGRPAIVRP